MTRLVVIDGVVQTPEHAVISVYDRGFLYGDSVFETVRTYSGSCTHSTYTYDAWSVRPNRLA